MTCWGAVSRSTFFFVMHERTSKPYPRETDVLICLPEDSSRHRSVRKSATSLFWLHLPPKQKNLFRSGTTTLAISLSRRGSGFRRPADIWKSFVVTRIKQRACLFSREMSSTTFSMLCWLSPVPVHHAKGHKNIACKMEDIYNTRPSK